MQFQAQ